MSSPEHIAFRLSVVVGPPMDAVLLREGSTSLGRSSRCDVVLDDGERRVSRHHATIIVQDGACRVMDEASRSGTRINGAPLASGDTREFRPGDTLTIGPWTFRLVHPDHPTSLVTSTIATIDRGEESARITRVPMSRRETLAQHRLQLLLDVMAVMSGAESIGELVSAILESARAGSGYPYAAVLRADDAFQSVEVLGAQSPHEANITFEFSRSLLRTANEGDVAALVHDVNSPVGESIVRLDIRDAVCAPIVIDEKVDSFLYLDTRGSMADIPPDAVEYAGAIAHLAGLALANLRRRAVEQDVALARTVQEHISPPPSGEHCGLRYVLKSVPGRGVAGDLFDVVPLDDHRVAFCLGDVSGEGVGAGLMMAVTLAAVNSALRQESDPAVVANVVNAYIAERSPGNMFVSIWIGVVDTQSNMLSFVDAGHGHWLLRGPNGVVDEIDWQRGMLLGIDSAQQYASNGITFNAGDRIIIFSDGIVEQARATTSGQTREEFGLERLIETVNDSTSAEEDVERLFAAVRKYAGSETLANDTTIASIEFVQPST